MLMIDISIMKITLRKFERLLIEFCKLLFCYYLIVQCSQFFYYFNFYLEISFTILVYFNILHDLLMWFFYRVARY